MSDLLIPVALSSQLDETGEEKIHAAPYTNNVRPVFVPPVILSFLGVSAAAADAFPPHEVMYAYAKDNTQLTIDSFPESTGRGPAWSKDAAHYVHPMDVFPFFAFYKRVGNSLTRMPNPAYTSNRDIGWAACWNPDSSRVAVAQRGNGSTYPYVIVLARSGDTYSEVANLMDASTGFSRANGVSYNQNGTLLAVSANVNPGLSLYQVAGDTYTKIVSPGSIPSANGSHCAFYGNYLAYCNMGAAASGPLTVYSAVGTTLSIIFQNTTDNTASSCAWSVDGAYLAVDIGNNIVVYRRDGETFTEVMRESWSSYKTPAFTPTHMFVTDEAGNKIRAYEIGTFTRDLSKDIPLPSTSSYPTEKGVASVTIEE